MTLPETVRCPTCRQPARWQGNPDRPFCSERCKLVDLGSWAAEIYRIPGASVPVRPDPEDGEGDDE